MNQTSRKNPSSRQSSRQPTLPAQFAKTSTVPFNLTLQEDKSNPGHFQLVVNLDVDPTSLAGSPPQFTASKKLYANPQTPFGLGQDGIPLYQTQKSSPPTSPQYEQQGWSDLDAIHPHFLQKVVPDWEVGFQRKDSTASTQSRKLSEIKARIKKSGKGFVVRLWKGSNQDANEVAEVHLGAQNEEHSSVPELDSLPQAELGNTEIPQSHSNQQRDTIFEDPNLFEIGTSGEQGLPNPRSQTPRPPSAVPEWLRATAQETNNRNSIFEDSFSDAETLTHDVLPFGIDAEPSNAIARTASISSIVKTPTRGLSVVGPVKRINKGDRIKHSRSRLIRNDLNRSDARKSFKRRSPRASASNIQADNVGFPTIQSQSQSQNPGKNEQSDSADSASDDSTWPRPVRERPSSRDQVVHRPSADELLHPPKQKTRLSLQTNVPTSKSANPSPVARRRRPRAQKHSSTSSANLPDAPQPDASPVWSEVDASDELREALEIAFGTTQNDVESTQSPVHQSIPRIEEPVDEGIGGISMPSNIELRPAPTRTGNLTASFVGLAISALAEKALEALHALRLQYGSEPPVPANHVRVRWTCVSTYLLCIR